jgi:hypothetical protein
VLLALPALALPFIQAGLETNKNPAEGEVFFVDFPSYRTFQAVRRVCCNAAWPAVRIQLNQTAAHWIMSAEDGAGKAGSRDGVGRTAIRASNFRKEGVVSGVPQWGRSSKRRVRLIRWTLREIVSVAGLACLIVLLSLMLAQWMAGHPFD